MTSSSLLLLRLSKMAATRQSAAAARMLGPATSSVVLSRMQQSTHMPPKKDDGLVNGVPKEDFREGHLLADHLEYVDDMIDRIKDMETQGAIRRQTKKNKKQSMYAASGIHFMEASEIDALFEEREQHISQGIANLKQLLEDARKTFAVEAPDGHSDAMDLKDQQVVDDIIEHAAQFEDTDAVRKLHADDEDAHKIFAVEAPDGHSDAMDIKDLEQVQETIEVAAQVEDADAVNYRHKMEEQVRKDRARDPEHDW